MYHSSVDSLPPFPDNLHHAPIAQISSAKLLAKDGPEAARVLQAARTYGFFYLDLRDSEAGRLLLSEAEALLDLAVEVFALSLEEKMRHALQKGVSLFGYKEAGTVKKTDPDQLRDSTEFFNVAKDHVHGITPTRSYPEPIQKAMKEQQQEPLLQGFTRHAHGTGLLVLRTLARQMGLGEEEFADLNRFDMPAGDHVRLTRKLPIQGENRVGLPSHTDFGSVTVLFNWLGGLQIESRTEGRVGEWEWVKPLAGHAVVNLGDAMVKFTNGELKSAKHRVVPAPGDQANLDRYSVVYFVRPHNDALMKPVSKFETPNGSHVKVGGKVAVGDDETKVYTAGEWMVKRSIQMGS